jgi:hypothetical protein
MCGRERATPTLRQRYRVLMYVIKLVSSEQWPQRCFLREAMCLLLSVYAVIAKMGRRVCSLQSHIIQSECDYRKGQ